MKKNLNRTGVIVLLVLFLLFYAITTLLLDNKKLSKNTIKNEKPVINESINNEEQINIVNNLYDKVKILYDVVNNKFTVSQDETIIIGDIVYKKITNFEEITKNIFTEKGKDKYINDLGSYFARSDNNYYLAGNLVSYQTYYFRGDNTNIYIINSNDNEINAIIYEKWTSNNKNTLATIKVVKIDNNWLIDNIDLLATE